MPLCQTRYGVILLCLLSVMTAAPALAQQASDAEIAHLLERASYGPAPGDIEAVRKMGIGIYIEKQLNPQSLPASPVLEAHLRDLQTLNASMAELADAFAKPKNFKDLSEDERKEIQRRQNTVLQELAAAKILRATLSNAQLQEVMVDFWYNHFNVFADKGPDKLMIAAYERDAIRPYALGKFGDLLNATARHPAMLFYLDNWLNTDPDSPAARGKKIGINENYARELMELHTLGVNGGYTQTDVTTLAHILTGWGLSEGHEEDQRTGFYFDPKRHDFTNQIWLGYQIRGGGEQEVESVLNVLAHQPATARHIAYELAQYFVADEPPPALVERLATSFRASDGNIAEVLRTLFRAPEFWDVKNTGQKFKPPFRYVVSSLRASGVTELGDTKLLQGAIGQMGEPLYRCLTPNGYAATNDQWLNSDALLKRIEFSKRLAGYLGPDTAGAIYYALGPVWSASTVKAVQGADPKLKTALMLSSPEFVYY